MSKKPTSGSGMYSRLVEASRGANSAELRSSLEKVLENLEREFLSKPADSMPDTSLFAARIIKIQGRLINSLTNGDRDGFVPAGIADWLASEWFHYRMLRARFKRQARGPGFALFFGRLGFAMSASIAFGPEKIRNWFVEQFISHHEMGFECPHTADKSFIAFCYWLAYRSRSSSVTANSSDRGIYEPIVAAGDASAIRNTSELRIAESYRQIIDNEPGLSFCGTRFPALFPFELLAAMKVCGVSAQPEVSALVGPFANLRCPDPLSIAFNLRCDDAVRSFERASGIHE